MHQAADTGSTPILDFHRFLFARGDPPGGERDGGDDDAPPPRRRASTDSESQPTAATGTRSPTGASPSSCSEWASTSYDWDTAYGDHFETPLAAYEDVAPMLRALGTCLGHRGGAMLTLYDPFYCQGLAKRRLHEAGFRNVIHEPQDVWSLKQLPAYDAMVTNPPFTGARMKQRCIDFIVGLGKPFAVLLPTYAATKAYMGPMFALPGGITLVVPNEPYTYTHPEGTGKGEAPWPSCWYCWWGPHGPDVLQRSAAALGKRPVRVMDNVEALVALGMAPPAHRRNPRQRRRDRRRKQGGCQRNEGGSDPHATDARGLHQGSKRTRKAKAVTQGRKTPANRGKKRTRKHRASLGNNHQAK